MSTIANYRKNTRKDVTLSDGTVIQVRALSASDFLELPDIPVAFSGAEKPNAEQIEKSIDPKFSNALMRTVLLNCVVSWNIVDKHSSKCADGEISLGEITAEDSAIILNAVVKMSGMAKEAAVNAKPFSSQ